jgi:hypothetical protein
MTKLPFIAFTALVAAAGLTAPALAATVSGQVPSCPTGTSTDYDSQIETLSNQLNLSTKLNSSVDVWSGCLKVTTTENGKTTMAFYEPDSLRLVAVI